MRLLYPFLAVFILGVCQTGCESTPKEPPAPPAPATYPLPPQGLLDSIFPFVTTVDFLFNSLPISMSVTEPNAIYTMYSHLSQTGAVPLEHGCKPIGRIFYVASGETALTGSLFFNKECHFVVFLENEEPVFAVQLNQNGITFLKKAGVPDK